MRHQGPILIGGTGRSGTTILIRILGLHPWVFALRWEGQFLAAPGGLLRVAKGGFQSEAVSQFVEALRGRWYRRVVNAGNPGQYEAGLSHDICEGEIESAIAHLHRLIEGCGLTDPERVVREFTERLLGPAILRAGAVRWCEKTPRNVLFVDELARIFPNLKFVHIIRDGRDVAASMVDRGFWPIAAGPDCRPLDSFQGSVTWRRAAAYWKTVIEIARERASRLCQHDCYIEVRFEDLIDEPERFLRGLCNFLGLPYSQKLLEQDLTRHHIGRWREEAALPDIECFYRVAGDTLERMGYPHSSARAGGHDPSHTHSGEKLSLEPAKNRPP